jgi:hypothetical protein
MTTEEGSILGCEVEERVTDDGCIIAMGRIAREEGVVWSDYCGQFRERLIYSYIGQNC